MPKLNLALVFSGQGSQYSGQTQSLEDLEYYKKADEVLGFSLSSICTQGTQEELNQTQITQPAILTHSWSLFQKWVSPFKEKFNISAVLGHSVGEYAALCAAEVFSFEKALLAVHERGIAMQQASPAGEGTMIALLKLDNPIIEKGCLEVSTKESIVSIANYNSPGQTVVSGHQLACTKLVEWLKENSSLSFRSIPLKVSAPFHCPLMQKAQEHMSTYFSKISFQPNRLPYIANIDAHFYPENTSPEKIQENLIQQITGSVQWTQSIQSLPELDLILELGPGKTLKGLNQRIRPEQKFLSLDHCADLELWKGIIHA